MKKHGTKVKKQVPRDDHDGDGDRRRKLKPLPREKYKKHSVEEEE